MIKKTWSFSTKIRNKEKMSPFTTAFQHHTEAAAKTIRQEEEKRRIIIGKGERSSSQKHIFPSKHNPKHPPKIPVSN